MPASRRTFLTGLAAAAASTAKLGAVPPSKMGIAATSYMTVWQPKDTLQFIEHCHGLGAAGVQVSLSSQDPGYLKKLRGTLEKYGMWIEVMAGLPRGDDAAGFERAVQAAKDAGALCVRAASPGGRRYEKWSSLTDWQRFITEFRSVMARVIPIVEKHRIPFAIENHKDWTADEMVSLIKDLKSEYVGVCLDTGNNIALLDDPMETVEMLAPYTLSTHIKDMALELYPQGFLLSEVPLGEGFLDLKRVISTISAKARPNTRMTLEMITRDPLEVPCLTDKYWATFPERGGRYMARMLRLARDTARKQKLPRIGHLSRDQQLRLEDDNVKQCLHYAREQLGL